MITYCASEPCSWPGCPKRHCSSYAAGKVFCKPHMRRVCAKVKKIVEAHWIGYSLAAFFLGLPTSELCGEPDLNAAIPNNEEA